MSETPRLRNKTIENETLMEELSNELINGKISRSLSAENTPENNSVAIYMPNNFDKKTAKKKNKVGPKKVYIEQQQAFVPSGRFEGCSRLVEWFGQRPGLKLFLGILVGWLVSFAFAAIFIEVRAFYSTYIIFQ